MPLIDFENLVERTRELASGPRRLLAIAGAPGSGKSTIAERLVERINSETPGTAALLPMDGYHFDDTLLRQMGRLSRKGAPDTFDVGGLVHMLQRLRDNREETICVPVFDRDIEIARAGARMIARSVPFIVIEGNYLLLRQPPWNQLRTAFDLTVMLDVPFETLRRRLTDRWIGYGLTGEALRAKLEDNDLPNAQFVIDNSSNPDFQLANNDS